MPLASGDLLILRELARQIADVATLPVHEERAELWTRLNDLERVRPLVWINEIPWHEMNVDDELTLRTTNPWAREREEELRRLLYQWNHLPGDMIVSNHLPCPLAIHSTRFGISEDVDIVKTDEASTVVSRHFHRQIVEPGDIEKIKMPQVTHDEAATEGNYERMCNVFDGIMPVRKVGRKGLWFAPWDELIRWWGVQEAMIDLVARPQMVDDIVSRFVDACLHELDQLEALNALTLNNDNTRIGSGAYGHTGELPGPDFDSAHVRPKDMWGSATAQIFSDVSPDMHWEFALKHEMRWLERWGLTYYGCCEPLHLKIPILQRIPNLRKISMSAWVDVDSAVAQIGDRYVYSCKPNPAILAEDEWRPDQARCELRAVLERTRDCRVEIILKDISTVRYHPRRLWQWAEIAADLAHEFA